MCSACEGATPSREPTTTVTSCAQCNAQIPVADAVATVRGNRLVQQCADCAAGRFPVAVTEVAPAPPPRRPSIQRLALAAVLLAFVAAPALTDLDTRIDLDSGVDTASDRVHQVRMDSRDGSLSYGDFMADDPRPVQWSHPLAGDRRLPRSPSRLFGAPRGRDNTRSECGRGHCGVDLGHLRGEVVHSAGAGIIDKIVLHDDGLSGRYVRIRHSSGYATFYMHLGRVHPNLEVGDEISAGAPVGTIGLSGIEHSSPHLHFGIRQGETFIDPEPILRKAAVRESEAPFPGPDQG